jgi:hypothetical protein
MPHITADSLSSEIHNFGISPLHSPEMSQLAIAEPPVSPFSGSRTPINPSEGDCLGMTSTQSGRIRKKRQIQVTEKSGLFGYIRILSGNKKKCFPQYQPNASNLCAAFRTSQGRLENRPRQQSLHGRLIPPRNALCRLFFMRVIGSEAWDANCCWSEQLEIAIAGFEMIKSFAGVFCLFFRVLTPVSSFDVIPAKSELQLVTRKSHYGESCLVIQKTINFL